MKRKLISSLVPFVEIMCCHYRKVGSGPQALMTHFFLLLKLHLVNEDRHITDLWHGSYMQCTKINKIINGYLWIMDTEYKGQGCIICLPEGLRQYGLMHIHSLHSSQLLTVSNLRNPYLMLFVLSLAAIAWHPIHENLFVSGGSDGGILFWQVGWVLRRIQTSVA